MINTYVRKFKNRHSIAEFMIIPKYRRKKLGERVAFDCFNMYKGNGEVSPSFGSETAYNFWNNVISKYTINSKKYEDRIFTFINK